jgi:hypothetical protein
VESLRGGLRSGGVPGLSKAGSFYAYFCKNKLSITTSIYKYKYFFLNNSALLLLFEIMVCSTLPINWHIGVIGN